jgi:hypothetical protein
MKLADSWIEDAPARTALEGFHDEVEEHDEVDEAEDGCGAVPWLSYVLNAKRTSNKMLHELAREIKRVERSRGKKHPTLIVYIWNGLCSIISICRLLCFTSNRFLYQRRYASFRCWIR